MSFHWQSSLVILCIIFSFPEEDLYEVFVVFHDNGYTVYEPMHCHIKHQVGGTFNMFRILPDYGDTLATLCEEGQPCSWGEAVNVRNKFLYVSQPKLNRVVVIEIQDRSNPVEVCFWLIKFPLTFLCVTTCNLKFTISGPRDFCTFWSW